MVAVEVLSSGAEIFALVCCLTLYSTDELVICWGTAKELKYYGERGGYE